ncbi:MAG TPA: hypothetical protein VFC44_24985 [Candidatus Saccharimonadales bacterium]|nr:hypothetical protein [Candidatus Saccharimonadales bacterium]
MTNPPNQPERLPPPGEIREKAGAFIRQWIAFQQGSPAELIRGLEETVGWPARHCLVEILEELRRARAHPELDRKYLLYTLSEGAVAAALAEEAKPVGEHQSSVDELLFRSRQYRRTKKFAEAVEFISRFREYSPYNNMLLYFQNPMAVYFATAAHWHRAFGRTIKEEARGMIILAPRTPVLVVYDVSETEGQPLPDKLENFARTSGRFNPVTLERTVKNCERDCIRVFRKELGQLRAGFSTSRVSDAGWKMRIALRAELDDAAAYAVLCHELAHIYLGHLGADKDAWWPYRQNLSQNVAEIEAEAVAHIVCRRAGLRLHSAEYLASFVEDNADLDAISIDFVSRTAGRIEEMGRRLLPPRDK